MSTVGKVIIGVGVVFFLIVVIVVAGAVYWWSYGGGKQLAENTTKNIEKAQQEGEEYGRSVESQACVDEALTRNKKVSGFNDALSVQIFTKGCLKTSRETPGFCAGVPKPTQILDTPQWLAGKCRERAPNDQFCPQVFQKVQEHCYLK